MKRIFLLAFCLPVFLAISHAQYTFTSIDYPGGDVTTTHGINNRGDIVGGYRITPPRHAFLLKGGNFAPLAPTTVLGTHFSEAFKTNDRGDVVGYYIGDDGSAHGFLLRKNGVLVTLDFPTASDTFAYDISESGSIVGSWDIIDSDGKLVALHGFTWTSGSFSEVNFPGSAGTEILALNARGDFAGDWFSDLNSPNQHAFVYSNGRFSSFDAPVPGTTITYATGINLAGRIVGAYGEGDSFQHAFLRVGNVFSTIDFPGAQQTTAWGINNTNQIVGDKLDTADSFPSGFLAIPTH